MQTTFLAQQFVPLMFCGLLAFLLTGFPVAFALAATGLGFGFIGMEAGIFPASLFQALPLRIFGIMQNDTLLAIPFFVLAGAIMNKAGITRRLLALARRGVALRADAVAGEAHGVIVRAGGATGASRCSSTTSPRRAATRHSAVANQLLPAPPLGAPDDEGAGQGPALKGAAARPSARGPGAAPVATPGSHRT